MKVRLERSKVKQIIEKYLDQISPYAKTLSKDELNRYVKLSDRQIEAVPGFDHLGTGAYEKDKMAVLFLDMRRSTDIYNYFLYIQCPPKIKELYLLMHTFLYTNMELIASEFGGIISEIPGDGIMAIFRAKDFGGMGEAVQSAGMCGFWLQRVREEILTDILKKRNLLPPSGLWMGVGISCGEAIITRIGREAISKIHIMGAFVNKASKLANASWNKKFVALSEEAKRVWPSGTEGKVKFKSFEGNPILDTESMRKVFLWKENSL